MWVRRLVMTCLLVASAALVVGCGDSSNPTNSPKMKAPEEGTPKLRKGE